MALGCANKKATCVPPRRTDDDDDDTSYVRPVVSSRVEK